MAESAGEIGPQADAGMHGRVDDGDSPDPSDNSISMGPVASNRYIRLLEDRLSKLESKIHDLEGFAQPDYGPAQSIPVDSWSSVQSDEQSEETPDLPQSAKPMIPSLSKISWFGFHNLLEGDDVFAIDVCSIKAAGRKNDGPSRKFRDEGESLDYKRGVKMFLDFKVPPGGADVVKCIRINSLAILTLLHDIDPKVPVDGSPLRLNPPFLCLIHYHDQVKQILDRTRSEFGLGSHSAVTTSDIDAEQQVSRQHRAEELLRHMDPYMHFMDTEVLPKYRRLGLPEVNTVNAKVRFSELPYLFRRDDDIYQPAGTNALSQDSLRHQEAWRILPDRIFSFYRDVTEESSCFSVICYHIAFDGRSYAPVRKCLEIEEFEGERDVTSLPMYPIRFMPNHREILSELRDRGARFLEHISSKQVSYQGWALQHPDGHGNDRTYISSNLVVDFAETSRAHPDWTVDLGDGKTDWKNDFEDIPFVFPEDRHSTLWGSSPTTNKLVVKTRKPVSLYDLSLPHEQTDTCLQKHRVFLEFSKKSEEPTAIGQLQDELKIQEHELVLLSKRLFAYALQDRKFVMLDIANAKSMAQTGDPFKELIISRSHKDMISSLVHAHFEKKQIEQLHGFYLTSQDIIHNKGRGLVILLHGVPGVGKSSTAEAVAQRWKRPLLAITCGDLGLEAADVEHSLKEIFRLAQLWDCVLLLDEADVFLSQRSVSDLQRNSLVSVFLRVLEYYSGILFLTTNRVGHIDEAFMSRIHISLYYPRLDLDQTVDIWRMNIDRLQTIEQKRSEATGQPALTIAIDEILEYAKKHFHARGPDRAWNGRQIRNAFQTAAALARYESDTGTSLNKAHENPHHVLSRHFKTVARAGRGFEDYLRETRGKSDSDLAYDTKTRADHMVENKSRKAPIISEAAISPAPSKYQGAYLNPNQDNRPSNTQAGGYQTAPQYSILSSGQYTPNAYSQGRASPQQFHNAGTNPFLSMNAGNPGHTTPSRSMTPQPPMESRGGNFSYGCVQNPSITLGQYHGPQDDDEFSD